MIVSIQFHLDDRNHEVGVGGEAVVDGHRAGVKVVCGPPLDLPYEAKEGSAEKADESLDGGLDHVAELY